jgi:hypothetical protein
MNIHRKEFTTQHASSMDIGDRDMPLFVNDGCFIIWTNNNGHLIEISYTSNWTFLYLILIASELTCL